MNVLTIGTFDILHFGHIGFLQQCRKLAGPGGGVMVGVNSDKFAGSFKEPPVMDQDERLHAIRQLGYSADLNTGPGREFIQRHIPNLIAVGSDWAAKDYLAQIGADQDWLDTRRIILAYVPRVQVMPMSTTEIRRRITDAG